jgi:hypothetical protein
MTDILGGAIRGKTRPRGFVDWKPRQDTLDLLSKVRGVLNEYAAHLPLTCRQVFYRLVGAHGYDKTERAYDRLCEMLNRARRANLIDMAAIRDGGGQRVEPTTFRDADDFMQNMRRWASTFQLDRQEGQPRRLLLLCEAAGMVPQLARVVRDYGLPVISSGGFESVTEKHALALELSQHMERVEVLHIGDHDPSGAHLFLALAEDVEAFGLAYDLDVSFTRLAVTREQIAAYGLDTAPAKATDNRAFEGETCQVEAIAPDDLAEIIQAAIVERLDQEAYDAVLEAESVVHSDLGARLK